MFRCSSEPLALSEASLLALRPALNAAVLNTDFLPVGPARAAIVVFAEEYGGIGLAIGVRSNESGQIAVFRNQEPIDSKLTFSDVLEPALVSAERMGFLFDEDMLESAPGGQGRARAMALWGSLMGEPEMSVAAVTPEPNIDLLAESATNLDASVPELLLYDVAPSGNSADLESQSESVVSPLPPTPPRQQLSRFRDTRSAAGQETALPRDAIEQAIPSAEEGSELGRVPIVRVRREGTKHVSFLARLLSNF